MIMNSLELLYRKLVHKIVLKFFLHYFLNFSTICKWIKMANHRLSFIDAAKIVMTKVRLEWKQFAQKEKIEFLTALSESRHQDLNKIFDIKNICEKDEDFVRECIKVSLENEHLFLNFFECIEQCIILKGLHILEEGNCSLKFLYDETIIAAVEEENLITLADILDRILSKKKTNLDTCNQLFHIYENIHKNLVQTNSPIFMSACLKDHYDLVRILVDYGCRLSLCDVKSWSFGDCLVKNEEISMNCQMFEGGDEINYLNILRLMAKPSYIMACYACITEKTFTIRKQNNKDQAFNIFSRRNRSLNPKDLMERPDNTYCKCHQIHVDSIDAANKHKKLEEQIHYCPDHPRFNPIMNCNIHLECNDPIFICFELANLAKGRVQVMPEYREEYEEISNQCRNLSVQLLDQCPNSQAVQTLLKESAGAYKYFRYTDEMMYPRLRLAMEYNHKEFVGHMFCQQLLRKQWAHQELWQWIGSPIYQKIIHCLLLVLTAPFLVLISLYVEIRRSFHLMYNKESTLHGADVLSKRLNWLRKKFNVPLNRLIIFTGYYLIFVGMVMLTIFDKQNEIKEPCYSKLRYGYFFFTIYAASFLWDDIQSFVQLKGQKTYFKFWRVFDLLLHISLIIVLVCKFIRKFGYPFDELVECVANVAEEENFIAPANCAELKKLDNITGYHYMYKCSIDPKENPCENYSTNSTLQFLFFLGNLSNQKSDSLEKCIDYGWSRKFLEDTEGIVLAIVAALSMIRCIYWLQLSERIGPLVINMSRVVMDLFTVMISYLMLLIAFTSGLVLVLANESDYRGIQNSKHTDAIKYDLKSFGHILYVLGWSILEPGDKTKAILDPEDKMEDLNINLGIERTTVATILISVYQTIIVIVLLNLLIAVMNTTVQKCEDRHQLYWKFVRTSIWIEYYDRLSGIPTPFSIVNLISYGFYYLVIFILDPLKKMIQQHTSKINGNPLEQGKSGTNTIVQKCRSADNWDRRKNYTSLMLQLIQKYNGNFQKENNDVIEKKHLIQKLNSIMKSLK